VAVSAVCTSIVYCIVIAIVARWQQARPLRVEVSKAPSGGGDSPSMLFELGLSHLERLIEGAEARFFSRLLIGDILNKLRTVLHEMRALSETDHLFESIHARNAAAGDEFTSNWLELGSVQGQYELERVRNRTSSEMRPDDSASQCVSENQGASALHHRMPNASLELLSWIGRSFDSWDFDVARLRSWCADTSMSPLLAITLAMHTSRSAPTSLLQLLSTTEGVLVAFVQRVVTEYWHLPYHSEIHACDVVHAATVMHRQICGADAPPHETGALLLSAIVHDLAHPGVNNIHLVETSSPLAVRYNDASVLENYHISLAFSLMLGFDRRGEERRGGGGVTLQAAATPTTATASAPGPSIHGSTECAACAQGSVNPLGALDKQAYKRVRGEMVALVLATSFEHHFTHISNLKGRAKGRHHHATVTAALPTATTTITGTATPPQPQVDDKRGAAAAAAASATAACEERLMLLKMIIKTADIGHPARSWAWHADSAKRACAEFFYQGECEARAGLPVSPLNNADECNLAKAQTGFLEFMVRPAFDVLRHYVESGPPQISPDALRWLDTPLCNLEENIQRWKSMSEDESAALKAQIRHIDIAEPFDPSWFADSAVTS
jgi:hypothetical protein